MGSLDLSKVAFIVFSVCLTVAVCLGKVDPTALISIATYLAPAPLKRSE